jgi:copper chaperone CopZ
MTHTYQLTGMTCTGCEAKVKSSLLTLPDVTAVELSKDTNTATITLTQHIALADLQLALGGANAKYQITAMQHSEVAEQAKSWFATYKPLLLILFYVSTVTAIVGITPTGFDTMLAMRVFMAGFFLVFSFFKLLDIKGFAESYAMYDIVAARIYVWGFIYPFVEFILGIAYAIDFKPMVTNWVALVVMAVSMLGVLQSIFNKRKIKCACLGAVFDLPMSTVTIVEDGLMIVMCVVMIFLMH